MKPVRVIPDPKHPGMWRLQWADGTRSAGMYNLTRANDLLRNYDRYRAGMEASKRLAGVKRGPRVKNSEVPATHMADSD